MEINFNTIDFNNLKRAFRFLEKIDKDGDLMSLDELSDIALYAHRDKYLLPLSHKFGSLFLFAIEMLDFKAAEFLYNNITMIDADEDVIASLDLAEEEYTRLDILNKQKELYETKQISVFGDMYKKELQNSIALSKLKENYPVKKRVRE